MRSTEGLSDATGAAKRMEALLRDARAALRKVDVLAAHASAMGEETTAHIAEARTALEHAVRQLTSRRQDELRRARSAVRRGV